MRISQLKIISPSTFCLSFDSIRSPLKELPKCPCAYCGKMLHKGEYTAEHFFKPRKIGSQDLRTFLYKYPHIRANIYRYFDYLEGMIFNNINYSAMMRDRMKRFKI